ncbi:MAG: hypothetical protein AB7G80_04685 [Dongiaceae bacterium]
MPQSKRVPEELKKEFRANHALNLWMERRAADPRPLDFDDIKFLYGHLNGLLGHLAQTSDDPEILARSVLGAIDLFDLRIIPNLRLDRLGIKADLPNILGRGAGYNSATYGCLANIAQGILAFKFRKIPPFESDAKNLDYNTLLNGPPLTVDTAEAFLKHLKIAQSGRQAKLAAQAARSVRSRAG